MPIFIAQPSVTLEIMHQLDIVIGYYRDQKGKGKRKRNSPQQADLEKEPTHEPSQKGIENIQGLENVEAMQNQDNLQVPSTEKGKGGTKIEVQKCLLLKKKYKPPHQLKKDQNSGQEQTKCD